MERLTACNNGHAYFPECFKKPCNGCGCAKENCDFLESVCRRLAEYEDTDHTPSMIRSLKKSEVNAHKTAIQHAMKLADYEKIGTPEECQDAVEKQREERPIAVLGIFGGEEYECKNCGSPVEYPDDYCRCCGNKQDWSVFE